MTAADTTEAQAVTMKPRPGAQPPKEPATPTAVQPQALAGTRPAGEPDDRAGAQPGAGSGAQHPATPGARPVLDPAERARRTAALRRHLGGQLFFELALPLGSYYGMRAAGVGQWLSMVIGSVLLLPWIAYGIARRRRLEATAVFTLSLVVVGTVLGLVTGSPRVLLVRDSWLTAAIAVWVFGTLFTRRPFMMTASRGVVIAKVGESGLAAWEARWDTEPPFRHSLRVLTAVWGTGFLLDAILRIVLAYTIPVDAFPLTSTLMWLALLGGLIGFHNWYIVRNGLKV